MHESKVIISNQIIMHVPYCFLKKHVNHAHQELANYNWFENFHLLDQKNLFEYERGSPSFRFYMTRHILGFCNLKYGHHDIFHLWKCKGWLIKTHMLHNIIHIQFFLGLVNGVLNLIELHLVKKQVPNCWHVWIHDSSKIHIWFMLYLC
jgi:hypothetical protein